MKIGIYSELNAASTLGGREFIVAVLCELFRRDGHQVEFLHHVPSLNAAEFAGRFGIDPDAVHLRLVELRPSAGLRAFWLRRRLREAWHRGLSEPYDLFINIVHLNPSPCYAKHGVLMVLFPFFEPYRALSGRQTDGPGRSVAWVLVRHLAYRLRWQRCMRTYALKTSISRFAQIWTRRRWHVDSEVIYPPTDSSFSPAPKRNAVLTVSRFSGPREGGLNKRQPEMMRAFVALLGKLPPDWNYFSVGGLGIAPQDIAFARDVEEAALPAKGRAHVLPNAGRTHLKELYESSKIFWHAAGYGDDDSHPELSEHFGIATVDAMAAGCIPVVINKGAQPEIVEHGISGFLWDTLEELQEYTLRLAADESLRAGMAVAAQQRAKAFSRRMFEERFTAFIRPVFEG